MGFPALASTSAGSAWAAGRPDNGARPRRTRSRTCARRGRRRGARERRLRGRLRRRARRGGRSNVALAVATGVAGLSVEDSTRRPRAIRCTTRALAVERVAAARAAIDASGSGVLLTARSEGFVVGRPDLAETIERLQAYADGGRRLPLRAAPDDRRAGGGRRRRGRAEAREPAHQRAVHHRGRARRRSACGGSASAARSRARRGQGGWRRPRRSRTAARSARSARCRTSTAPWPAGDPASRQGSEGEDAVVALGGRAAAVGVVREHPERRRRASSTTSRIRPSSPSQCTTDSAGSSSGTSAAPRRADWRSRCRAGRDRDAARAGLARRPLLHGVGEAGGTPAMPSTAGQP